MNKKIKQGIILSYISQIITVLSGVIYTPIMLRLLGQSEYGLYQLATSIVSYLSLLNLGFSSGYLRIYYRYRVKNLDDKIKNLNGLYLLIFIFISILAGVFGAILICVRRRIFGNSLTDTEIEKLGPLMIIMVISLVLTFLSAVFECYIAAYSEFVFQRGLQVAKGLLNPFITLPLLLSGHGSIAMAMVTLFLTTSSFICTVYYCITKLKMRFACDKIEMEIFKELSHFTLYIFISSVVNKINLSLDNFLLGTLSGTIMVSIYGVGSQINGFYSMITTSIASIFAPKINIIVAKSDDNDMLTEIFIKISRLFFLVLSFILVGFVFFGKKFIIYWAGIDYLISFYVALILMIGSFFSLTQICGIEIQKARNKHKARSIVYLIIAIINIIISIPLIKAIGPVGASLGTCITMIAGDGFFMNWYYKNKMGLNMKKYWIALLKTFPNIILSILVGLIYTYIRSESIVMYFIFIFLFMAVFLLSLLISARVNNKSIKQYMLG